MNTDKKDLSDKDKSYVTRLGVLIPPLPDRPSELSDEEKDRLDEMTTIYSMMENEDEKQDFMAQKGAELHIDEGTLQTYFASYMKTVHALSKSVTDICGKKLEFDNDDIARYTKETYSQEVIRDKILGIFDEAQAEYQKGDKTLS